ncbi:MAG: hypothetical protein EOO09_19325 [Chitinophagaceae bacterium]|nr:MAG: hypothetical protein EOO09_19325 [Chitinophagaceae bacterium]
MLKLNELKSGDIVAINDEGVNREGVVVKTSPQEHKALINNGIQEYWFGPEEITGLPLDDRQLARLGFVKEVFDNGVKYKKDSFRLAIHHPDDFSSMELWWREDKRIFNHNITVHQLQNLFLDMTKVHLEAV